MCELRIFGLCVAFLVFMVLKVKPKTLAEFSKPFEYIRAKKFIKNQFLLSGLWCGLQKNFFGLFHFFWDILCLRSLLGCSNPIFKFNIIPKGKWFKFTISNHSVTTAYFCIIKQTKLKQTNWTQMLNRKFFWWEVNLRRLRAFILQKVQASVVERQKKKFCYPSLNFGKEDTHMILLSAWDRSRDSTAKRNLSKDM